MKDRPVQSFVGSRSARENLKLITPSFLREVSGIHPSDRDMVMGGLEQVLSAAYLDTIWDMIIRRWAFVESMRHT